MGDKKNGKNESPCHAERLWHTLTISNVGLAKGLVINRRSDSPPAPRKKIGHNYFNPHTHLEGN